jgi:hypothetical protein
VGSCRTTPPRAALADRLRRQAADIERPGLVRGDGTAVALDRRAERGRVGRAHADGIAGRLPHDVRDARVGDQASAPDDDQPVGLGMDQRQRRPPSGLMAPTHGCRA